MKILEEADQLFRQRGFKSVTMDDIARQSGISKKTLYQYFENKSDVVEAVRFQSHELHHNAFVEIARQSQNAIEALLKAMHRLNEISRTSNPAALYELERFFPFVYSRYREEFLQKSVQIMRDNLKRGIAEGLYRADINIDLLAHYRVEMILMGMQSGSMMYDAGYSLEQISNELSEHFLCGVLSPKGACFYQQYQEAQQQQRQSATEN